MTPTLVVALIVIAIGALVLYRSVRIVPQATAFVVERLGRYNRTLNAGLNTIVPFIDQIRLEIDLREQVISFQPQPVITQDNLVVHIDTVIYYQVVDPKAATYEVAQFLTAIEQLTVTTLRNVIGGMDLERTLTSREEINTELRGVLDEATGKWGIRVNRVELKAIDPPESIKDSMEKQMRADRDKRASILSAEGQKQAAILTAEGERTAAVLRARGESEAVVLRAEAEAKAAAARAKGQAQAIMTVTEAIQDGNVDQRLLTYQYLQTLPKLAQGTANKVWFVPTEIGKALEGLGSLFGGQQPADPAPDLPDLPGPSPRSLRANSGPLARGPAPSAPATPASPSPTASTAPPPNRGPSASLPYRDPNTSPANTVPGASPLDTARDGASPYSSLDASPLNTGPGGPQYSSPSSAGSGASQYSGTGGASQNAEPGTVRPRTPPPPAQTPTAEEANTDRPPFDLAETREDPFAPLDLGDDEPPYRPYRP